MKIVHISTYHTFGGAAIAALRLHHALRSIGVKSSVLVQETERQEEGVQGVANSFIGKKLAFARFATERAYFVLHEKDKSVRFHFSPLWAGVDISKHPLVREADVIHLHWINFGFLSLYSLEQLFALGKPVVWTMHDMSTFTGGCHYSRECERYLSHCQHCPYLCRPSDNDLSFRVFEQKQKLFKNAPLTLVSPSQWLAGLAQRAALTKHLTSFAIPNPINTNVFKPSSAKKDLGLTPTKKWILFAGVNTQDPRKGFAYFKEATQLLSDRREEWGIVVFGKTEPEALADLGLEVKSLGSLPAHEVVNVYQAADVMVVPSLEDNYPNTVIEAMACGTPVVGFDSGGIAEQIEHLQTGYVAKLYSSEDLAKGIRFVLEDADYEQIAQKNLHVIYQRNRYETVAKQYLAVYKKLVTNN
ncbi:glycosyltransferase family 4 protein [Runella sp.]|uniref:glycosyltransferase family 4 protein n=1 Tax=Runella sp. TaxID=1960881 RepID=UPI003D0F5822